MKKPIIGIAGSCMLFDAGSFTSVEKYYINNAYIKGVEKNSGIPLAIPVLEDEDALHSLLDLCDGLLIPGGEDVDPTYFGENPHPKIGIIRPDMDKFVMKCLKYAFSQNMPIFGICRGLQIINVAKGGTLYQDLSLMEGEVIMHYQSYSRAYTPHKVELTEHSIIHNILGKKVISVNTMHHQSIHALGKGLKATGFAPDGVIEAIENEDGTIMAVQWHPEELTDSAPIMNKLFKYLINKASNTNSSLHAGNKF